MDEPVKERAANEFAASRWQEQERRGPRANLDVSEFAAVVGPSRSRHDSKNVGRAYSVFLAVGRCVILGAGG